jgi:hypothetical protein
MGAEARVGTIVIGMRVGLGGLTKGLSSAGQQLSGFAAFATSNIKAGLAALGVTTAVTGLMNLRASAAESMESIGDLADRAGASTEGLTALKWAAHLGGVEFEQVSAAMLKLGVNLAKATAEGKGSDGVFARLGISAGKLAQMDRVEAFKQIAESLKGIQNPAERSALAVELFGKAGTNLGILWSQGAAGIEAAQAEMERLGVSFSRVDVERVAMATDAWDKIGVAVEGVGQQLAIAVGPAFAAVFESIAQVVGQANSWFKAQGEGSNFVIGALGFVAKAFGVLVDVIHSVKLGFLAAQSVITTGLGFVVQGIAWVAKGLQEVINLIPGVKVEFGSFLETYADDLKRLGADQWAKFQSELAKEPPSAGVNAFFENLQVKAFEAKDAAAAVKKDWSEIAEVSADVDANKAKDQKPFAAAMELGSKEARSTILAFRRGGADETQKKIERNTRTQLDRQKAVADAVTQLAVATANMVPII